MLKESCTTQQRNRLSLLCLRDRHGFSGKPPGTGGGLCSFSLPFQSARRILSFLQGRGAPFMMEECGVRTCE